MYLEEVLYTHDMAECSAFRDKDYAVENSSERPFRYHIISLSSCCHWSSLTRIEYLLTFRTMTSSCFLVQYLKIDPHDVRYAIEPSVNVDEV